MSLLEIKNLYKSFGGLGAVINFNFTIQSGELIGLIGPNGAGKTTVFNLITGSTDPIRVRFYSRARTLPACLPILFAKRE
jgi:branched-chain amino acid transport system ATP-binding protein